MMKVSTLQLLSFILSIVVLLVIPLIVLLVKSVIRWTKVEAKVDRLGEDLRQLVDREDRARLLLMETSKEDRVATDKRLRWLEEYVWKGQGNAVRN